MKLLVLVALMASPAAFAGGSKKTMSFAASSAQKLSLQLGHSTTLSLPADVSQVTLTDPSKVEVKKQGRKVTLTALEKGTTEATIKTKDGVTKVSIYVAADKYAMPY
ncbi:MAG: pilus assembly protein N-terminal domain-containing protein [Myxococcaceae bacterium]|nr:pilus assembly protein N-terminal domain-containing protein [Myxococcaceae bacterium]